MKNMFKYANPNLTDYYMVKDVISNGWMLLLYDENNIVKTKLAMTHNQYDNFLKLMARNGWSEVE